jgi:hypothetical protein
VTIVARVHASASVNRGAGAVITDGGGICHVDRVKIPAGLIIGTALVAGCGGSKTTGAPDMAMADMSGPVIQGEHGTLVDYFSMMPLAGLTVTDGTNSTTTGADGSFVLPAPMGVTLSPFASGTGYATLHLPEGTAASVDVNLGVVPMAQTSSFALEQNILANDQTKALVHILIVKTGACASIANGTVTVNAPAGAKLAYFSTAGIPTAPTMYDIAAPKPAAVVYDVTPAAALDITINAPGCTQVPFGTTPLNGLTLNGNVVTPATEPGDQAAALVFVLQ